MVDKWCPAIDSTPPPVIHGMSSELSSKERAFTVPPGERRAFMEEVTLDLGLKEVLGVGWMLEDL